jgi:hypothetical protein
MGREDTGRAVPVLDKQVAQEPEKPAVLCPENPQQTYLGRKLGGRSAQLMAEPAYLTVCTNSHIGFAITLAKSLRSAVPGARLLAYVADRFDAGILPNLDEIEFLATEALGIAGFQDMADRYNAFEFSTAMKAPCILDAIQRLGAKSAVYLDSDTFVLRPLDGVTKAFADGYDCILTPHITRPTRKGESPQDRSYLTAGVFNLGFAAFSSRQPAIDFLRWWAGKKREDCTVNLAAGVFVDQTYCNLAPAFIERLLVLRNPGYNLAYWNLDQRSVSIDADGSAMTEGEQVRLLHFSGADFRKPGLISRHSPGLKSAKAGDFGIIFDAYLAEVAANDALFPNGFSSIRFALPEPDPKSGTAAAKPLSIPSAPSERQKLAVRLRRMFKT